MYTKLKGLKFTNYTTYNLDLKYFKLSEFDSPDEAGSGYKMDKEFLMKLDYARGMAGIPFKITSGFRTKEHHLDLGKRGYKTAKRSAHCEGYAADIACAASKTRWLIIGSLMLAGFNRIGIGSTFIHADNIPNKTPHRVWTY